MIPSDRAFRGTLPEPFLFLPNSRLEDRDLRSLLTDRFNKVDPCAFFVTISWVGVSAVDLNDAASPLRILLMGESGGFGDTCLLLELDRLLSLELLRRRPGFV